MRAKCLPPAAGCVPWRSGDVCARRAGFFPGSARGPRAVSGGPPETMLAPASPGLRLPRTLRLRAISGTDQIQTALESLRDTRDHIGHQRAHGSAHGVTLQHLGHQLLVLNWGFTLEVS